MTVQRTKTIQPMITPPAEIQISENGRQVLQKRYLRKGLDGQPIETIEGMFRRVAHAVAAPDVSYGYDVEATEDSFYGLLTSLRFFPNSPTFTGADTPLGQLAACFVIPIVDDLGKQPEGIFQTLRDAALIQQTGGGNGFSFSRLRPKGDSVASSAGVASGPIGFLRVYDTAFGEVAQGGCLVPETLVFTSQGLLRLDEIANTQQRGWQPHQLEVASTDGWQRSPRAFNNGIAPIWRVYTRQGLSLAGTPDHRVQIITADGPAWQRLEDLKSGDWIMVRLGQHRGKLQALRHPSRQHGNQVWPRLPAILDEELAFFLGYLTGDGFVAKAGDDHRIGVSVSHASYLSVEMPALLERLFGATVHRQQKPDDASATFVIDNRAIKEFLLINGFDKARSRDASVPRLIRKSPPAVVGAYLRGLFEADGTLVHGYPSLSTTSPRLVDEVAALLIGLGCPVQLRSITPGITHYGKATVHHLTIRSTVGLQAWRERIGCDQRSRLVAAFAWESDLRRESSYTLPYPRYWLQPVLHAITLEQVDKKGRGMGLNFRSLQPRLRRSILRYLRSERQFTRSAYDELARQYPEVAQHALNPDGWWFVRVEGVEPAGESLTLDLEVDETHAYLAYGMVTHNTRRGANMAVLRVDHPDIEQFITCKATEGQIANFNISVGITDAFMQAVEADADFELANPRDGVVWRTVRARDLFDKMVTYAHRNGEPGALFLDAANRSNPVPHLYELEATNPCGEQWLGPYENCCLGSINLAQHVTGDNHVDWEKLAESAVVCTRFLDNVVDANKYVPSVPQLREAALRARRIGLGIMGLGDMMYHVGVRYGSAAAQELAAQVMEFIRYHAMRTSIELARERGPFTAIKGSIYDPENLHWQPPQPLAPYTHDWGRPAIDWSQIVEGIKQHGIRNAAQTTVAPTGTIGTVAGCEGYGCEPVFALAYTRTVKDNSRDLKLTYTSPLFEAALVRAGLNDQARERISQQVSQTGSCQDVVEVPASIRQTFVVSQDITAEEHVRMQAAIQAFVDNSISKCVTGNTLILTNQGLVPISELSEMRVPDQFEPLSIEVVTSSGIERTDAFYYGGMRETRRVRLSYGYQVEGTPNHRIHVLDKDGSIRFVRLDELKLGDTVVLYSGQQMLGPEGQAMPGYCGTSRTNAKEVSFPERMSPDLAYILGCITSEGAIGRNGVYITNGDRKLLEHLGRLFEQVFDLSSPICKDTRRESVYTLQVNSRALRNWLLAELGLEAGARNKIIPTCILRAGRSEVIAFLRGLFLDAYMIRNGRMFGIGLASRALLHQLQVMLLNFGIASRIHKAREHAWALTVAGSALDRLAAMIEFDETWKSERIAHRDDGRQHRLFTYAELMPQPLTESLHQMQLASDRSLRSLYGEQTPEYQRARVNTLRAHRLDRQLAATLYNHFRDTPDPYAQAFFEHDQEGCVYVDVEAIESNFAEVFDLSVPGSHTFVANGLGNHNTINFPSTATVDDVKQAYQLAWHLGCKGLTVYVTGSRQEVVLETKAVAEQKTRPTDESSAAPAETNGYYQETKGTHAAEATPHVAPAAHTVHTPVPLTPPPLAKRPRPSALAGVTYRKETPLGTAFVTVNVNGDEQPFEVFLNVGKAGSDVAAVSEALGRLISLILRLPSSLATVDRLKQVIDQLAGIGGGRTLGFGAKRVRSLPDAVAQVLREHIAQQDESDEEGGDEAGRCGSAAGRATGPAHRRPSHRRPMPGLRSGKLHPDRRLPEVLCVRV